MDGYDIHTEIHKVSPIKWSKRVVTYQVYTIKNKIKRYKNGYSDYKSMIKKHPELIA